MIQTESTILSNERLSLKHWKMTIEATQIASEVKPGQFVHTRLRGTLLRRPFSVYRRVNIGPGLDGIEIVYKVVGHGTGVMTTLRPEEKLDIIGPLGHGFQWEPSRKVHVLLAGGVGSAGLFMLGEEISKGRRECGTDLYIILGAKTKNDLILEKEFKTLNGKVMIATDDGTYGHKGLATEVLEHAIRVKDISSDCAIYSSGPQPMLKALSLLCRQYNLQAQVALEERMLCGIGACSACVCKVNRNGVLKHRSIESSHIQLDIREAFGYALVCRDGPVKHLQLDA